MTTAIETVYACGHVEVHSEIASLADPSGLRADLRVYQSDPGLCTMCRNPEKYKEMLDWRFK